MELILSDVMSLSQYVMLVNTEKEVRPSRCCHCGFSTLWIHGCYFRKADRSSGGALNPVAIIRYLCAGCWRTCSALPECLPPRRWYSWKVQQLALLLLLEGASLCAAASKVTPDRRTIGRWLTRFREMYRLHRDALCNHLADLGRTVGFEDFWRACLQHFSLAKSMHLCHAVGVSVP